MSDAPDATISLTAALETLGKLQNAAPSATATKLRQVSDLLKHLADENTYLGTLIVEMENSQQKSVPDSFYPAQDVDLDSDDDPPDENSVKLHDGEVNLFAGLNDALRPPLIAIRGRAELVQAGLLGQITSDQNVWLQAIYENTDRAFAVLDALHEMIALQKGSVQIDTVNFISTDLLSEAWERIRDKARLHNHDVSIQAPDVVPLAHGDFYHSLIVLTDLLDNALRYTPSGGQIRMSVDNLGSHVLFSVADNGIGLSPDDAEHVGRPFWRGDHQRLVRQHTGTGLRLYLAKQILALQGGELIFSGEPGLGSTFSFTLRAPD